MYRDIPTDDGAAAPPYTTGRELAERCEACLIAEGLPASREGHGAEPIYTTGWVVDANYGLPGTATVGDWRTLARFASDGLGWDHVPVALQVAHHARLQTYRVALDREPGLSLSAATDRQGWPALLVQEAAARAVVVPAAPWLRDPQYRLVPPEYPHVNIIPPVPDFDTPLGGAV